jgi:hypothetical protein
VGNAGLAQLGERSRTVLELIAYAVLGGMIVFTAAVIWIFVRLVAPDDVKT